MGVATGDTNQRAEHVGAWDWRDGTGTVTRMAAGEAGRHTHEARGGVRLVNSNRTETGALSFRGF